MELFASIKYKPFDNNNNQYYDGLKYNCVIMLEEILKYSNNLFSDDLKRWIFKKALQGTKSSYWDILNITDQVYNKVLEIEDYEIKKNLLLLVSF